MPRPDYDPSEELPEGRGVFYRAHLKDAPLDEAHARSRPIGPDSGSVHETVGQRGYSAFASPHHLSIYMDAQGWHRPEYHRSADPMNFAGREVIAFHGREVGRGADKEPLVVPEANPHCCGRVIHSRTGWNDFEDKIWNRVGVSPEQRDADPFFYSNDRSKETGRMVPWSRWKPSAEQKSVRRNQEKKAAPECHCLGG